MTIPAPIGPLVYNEARAVRVSEPEHPEETHSAVSTRIHILVETQLEADAILKAFPIIMQATADKAQEILSAMRNKQSEPV